MKNERLASNNLPSRQRGAIGLFAVMTLMIAILFVTLVVDTGRLWMQKRQLQSIADIAAIEAGRSLGCGSDIELRNAAQTAAQAAAVANGFGGTLASSPNIVELGSVATNAAGIRQFDSGNGNEAVRVVATRSVPASLFAGGLFNEQVLLSAEAVSIANVPIAAFSAGTSTVELNTEDSLLLNSLLSEVLGSNVNLSLASYQGLAKTQINLAQLLEEDISVATPDELLNKPLPIDDLIGAILGAAEKGGVDVESIPTSTGNGLTVRLMDVLNIAASDMNAVMNVGISALSLLNTAVIVANGKNIITLPLTVGINAGLVKVNTSTSIIIGELPQIAIGPPAGSDGNVCTVARTAQVEILSTANVDLLLTKVGLNLGVEVTPGMASLESIDDNGVRAEVVINGESGLAKVKGNLGITLLGIKVLSLNLDLADAQPSQNPMVFTVQHQTPLDLPQSLKTSSQLSNSLENLLAQKGKLLDNLAKELLGPILRTIIDPLLKLLGIQLGVLEVNLQDVQLIQPQPLVI